MDVAPRTTTCLNVGNADPIQTGDHIETLSVVDDSPGHANVCVLYPGAGACWVARSNVVASCALVLPAQPTAVIRNLTIQTNESTSLTTLMRFPKLEGATIETLALHALRALFSAADHRAVSSSAPP